MEFSEEKRKLTPSEIDEICDVFILPFQGIDFALERANKDNRKIAEDRLEDIEIYPSMFEEFKDHLQSKFYESLIEPQNPIGLLASDAIGQQSMQAVLNTFHNVGNAKSGGPEGIRENISISKERKIQYSVIALRNQYMSFKEVMRLKSKFIGASISFLLKQKPEPLLINIDEEIKKCPIQNVNEDTVKKYLKGNNSWWYAFFKNFLNGVYDENTPTTFKRKCIRLTFDMQKLYEFKLTPAEIATFINEYVFKITQHKYNENGQQTENSKRKTSIHYLACIPSPSFVGIVDIYMKNYSPEIDHFLMSLLHKGDFDKIFISGIGGITNFYPINTTITRLCRSIEDLSKKDIINEKKGCWLYLDDNRFITIPYFRIIKLLRESGINFEFPSFGTPLKTSDGIEYTTIPFEFHSHKIEKELRKRFSLRAYTRGEFIEHRPFSYKYPSFHPNGQFSHLIDEFPKNDHYSYVKTENKGFDVFMLLLYEKDQEYVVPFYPEELEDENELQEIINKLMISKTEIRVSGNKFMNAFFSNVENNFKNEFKNFFEGKDKNEKYCGFKVQINEIDSKYFYFRLFTQEYIDYKIEVNLDYVNSNLVTQSLDSMLAQQFFIPKQYFADLQLGFNIPEILRSYRIFDVEKFEEPVRRILLKTKRFMTDDYDFLGEEDAEKYKKDNNKKLTPISRFLQYVKENIDEKYDTYVYAETSGANLSDMLNNSLINPQRTFCNNYHQTLNVLGLEAMRNLLTYDMISMVNSSGYINVSHINLQTNVTTHNGPNPMTSAGAASQKRGLYDIITFDNAGAYILSHAFKSKIEQTGNVSSSILIGQHINIGTTATEIRVKRMKLISGLNKEGYSEKFLKISDSTYSGEIAYFNLEKEKQIEIPATQIGKFPNVKKIMEKYVNRDLVFYIKNGIDKEKRKIYNFAINIIPSDQKLLLSTLIKPIRRASIV